ncbi:unnamed protein product [Didymodactylos carnosus]|uniref:Uncharacterized protein n=1 Tax=Didymodactylos carnosus TaxID=1234261 RepID=A0A8S2LQP9_9BILA|nr:unnamed protein product [Didymodactylos carnosus]CAF3916826.1 unnamed protein product [Didymodactylos carnosus]
MALTPAQKQKHYRKNLAKKGLNEVSKAKIAARMKAFRKNLTGITRAKYLEAHADSQKRYKERKKEFETMVCL